MKKLLVVLFSAFLVMMLVVGSVPFKTMAADDTYIIRVFAGEQGTIGGAAVAEYEVAYGSTFTFDINTVDISGTVDEDGQVKYYATGIHEGGKEGNVNPSFTVTGDRDLVVTYGLASGLVQYTVHYIFGTTELGSDSYYAHDGEKAIAAAKYFDGYIPEARNITGTVRKGQANDWYLNYIQGAAAEEETTAAAAGAAATGGNAGAAAGGVATDGNAGAAAGGVATGGEATGGEVTGGTGGNETGGTSEVGTDTETPQTQDIIDIDDPLAAPGASPSESTTEAIEPETTTQGGNNNVGGISPLGAVGIIAGGVAVAGGVVAIIVSAIKRKKNNS